MNLFNKIKALVFKHKFISAIIIAALIAIIYFGYVAIFNKKTGATYVSSAVTKGIITTSVSGSGQVSAQNNISLQ